MFSLIVLVYSSLVRFLISTFDFSSPTVWYNYTNIIPYNLYKFKRIIEERQREEKIDQNIIRIFKQFDLDYAKGKGLTSREPIYTISNAAPTYSHHSLSNLSFTVLAVILLYVN